MSRHAKNVEQIRSLLRQMDRSIDDARTKREGTGRPTAAPNASNAPTIGAPTNGQAPSSPSSQLIGGSPSPAPVRPVAQPAPQRPIPPTRPPTNSALSGAPNPKAQPDANQPQRLKAKPKRSSSDPLQDFQQRQAS